MFHEIYPIPVYNTKLDNHLQVQKDFEEVVKDDSNFKQNSGWHCNVDTTFGLVDANSLPFQNFIKGAIRGLNEYLRHLGIDQPVSYGVECWLNRYNKNQHQELHNHAGACVISCAYMMNLPPDSGKFVFYRNTYDFFHNSKLPLLTSNHFIYNNRITPPLEEGDIVFFPSVLEHYVTVNESNKTRATISANFTINERINEEEPNK